jgi:hypothetical protein
MIYLYANKMSFMKKDLTVIPVEIIERKIYLIRGMKVMLDRDLAFLYEINTKVLIQAIKRNKDRFPYDFMFQISEKEFKNWRSQIVTSNPGAKMGLRRPPYVFTEHGVAMLSSVLKSKKAVQVNVAIVRAFIKLRELLATHKDLILEIDKIKREQKGQNKRIQSIISIINQMLNPPIDENREPMGFRDREVKIKK